MKNDNTMVIRRDHVMPATATRDAPLALHEVAPVNCDNDRPPLVLLHGATFGAPMFDLPLAEYSMQAFFAERGWRSFALDIRGYGRSQPAGVLDEPPMENPPYARLPEAVEDLASGVRFVIEHVGCEKVDLLGFSWGTVAACKYAEENADNLERLVLYAPLYGEVNDAWIAKLVDPDDMTQVNPVLGSYRWIGREDLLARWDADIPTGVRPDTYRDDLVLTAIIDSLAQEQSMIQGGGNEPLFKAPCGALVDLFDIFSGRPLYNPARIHVPTLVVRGSDDTTSTHSDAMQMFDLLATTQKHYTAISPGSHFLCVERNAKKLSMEISQFLERNL